MNAQGTYCHCDTILWEVGNYNQSHHENTSRSLILSLVQVFIDSLITHSLTWALTHAHYTEWHVGQQRDPSTSVGPLLWQKCCSRSFQSVAFLSPPSTATWSSDGPSFSLMAVASLTSAGHANPPVGRVPGGFRVSSHSSLEKIYKPVLCRCWVSLCGFHNI